MPPSNNITNKISIKVNRKAQFVSVSLGAGVILLDPEEALEIAEAITKHADRILKASQE
jgi:GGDEF domain-containing protein